MIGMRWPVSRRRRSEVGRRFGFGRLAEARSSMSASLEGGHPPSGPTPSGSAREHFRRNSGTRRGVRSLRTRGVVRTVRSRISHEVLIVCHRLWARARPRAREPGGT